MNVVELPKRAKPKTKNAKHMTYCAHCGHTLLVFPLNRGRLSGPGWAHPVISKLPDGTHDVTGWSVGCGRFEKAE